MVLSDNKPLPELMLNQISAAIWRHVDGIKANLNIFFILQTHHAVLLGKQFTDRNNFFKW